MRAAVLKWFDPARGLGSLALADGADIFVHLAGEEHRKAAALRAGQRVLFTSKLSYGLGREIATSLRPSTARA